MNKHSADVGAIAGFIAGGGLAGVFVFVGMVWPRYQALANGAAIALVAVAGLVRTIANPTPPAGQQPVYTTSVPPKAATLTTPEQNAQKAAPP